MPTKHIYIREEENQLFKEAKELSGAKTISAAVLEALREYISSRKNDEVKIEIKLNDEVQKFIGKRVDEK